MWTYRLRYVRCGKQGCRCETGAGHGPYWYGFEHRGDRVYTKYFGKRPTSTFDYRRYDKAGPEPDPRWEYTGPMSMRAALRIFGLDARPNHQTLVARYRVLAQEHHPDHGGSNDIMVAINAAYAYLR